jgi:endonuclease G
MIVILPVREDDAGRVTTTTRVIAVETANNNGVNSSSETYRTTVDAIESETGCNLLSNVSEWV